MLLRYITLLASLPLFCSEVYAAERMLEESKQHSPKQYMSSGSGEENAALCNSQTKGCIPKTDHSKGVYMHDHPEFPAAQGGPDDPYRTHYLHARFGIGGQKKKRSPTLEETMLKIFNIRLPKKDRS
ncbi:uncharacterized protein LOC141876880 [Acropora palmata]|uniref:uncharacterized protein LOC141876880 n=1 Tax=Acropora palmata TaxID=6131 RepID=UPI003DA1749D